ncbi:glycosyl hydrolase family 39 [Niabella beijingensis]|uniref:glycosyl hydrolase family 39 n=1 Tax=Niabella beijingensis TaxID=2872700 RepID=UPI001CBFD720|nr:glycosyl hydrolase family 39 [Niabella beijingensis]MBZ4191101.1 glycosyl hydrolase family 39 [Niabella beijingensis]
MYRIFSCIACISLSLAAINGIAQEADTLEVDWNQSFMTSKTTPTLQVVENPMVRPGSPIHQQTFKALKDLGADYVRYVPWFPYPKMAVAALKPPDSQRTYWDFTYLDSTMKAIMEATDGHSVVINFSTTPAWMWKTPQPVVYPEDPYSVSWDYNQGRELRDSTGQELAGYYARLLSWYTKGGFTDERGTFHKSGHFYKIPYWEVLNEPDLEHAISPELYTKIYDRIVVELKKISPHTKFIGLSLAHVTNPAYFEYFLNRDNHRFGIVPEGISYHHYSTPSFPDQDLDGYQYAFFEKADAFMDKVRYIENIRKRLAPQVFTTINEIGSILRSPQVIKPIPAAYWNLSGAVYAYLFLQLTKTGIDVAGESQLVGYPTQFPDVSMMNWETGNPNARYWVLKMIHDHLGSGDQLMTTGFKNNRSDGIAAQAYQTAKGRRILLINTRNTTTMVRLPDVAKNQTCNTVDGRSADQPPFQTKLNSPVITMAPFAVCIVQLE